jgi:hypothetical protein
MATHHTHKVPERWESLWSHVYWVHMDDRQRAAVFDRNREIENATSGLGSEIRYWLVMRSSYRENGCHVGSASERGAAPG